MRDQDPKRQRSVAALAGMLATMLALSLGWGTSNALAQNADEEEVPADTKLLRQLFKDLGLRRNGEGIDYRERARDQSLHPAERA